MATAPFLGVGEPVEAFNINNVLINKVLLPGEVRMRTAFTKPTLEQWRRAALNACAANPTTGTSQLSTQGRTVLLFAHEADLGGIFYDVVGTNATMIAGYYVDKLKAQAVDKTLVVAVTQANDALLELKALGVPDQYLLLLRSRLESVFYGHRVAGLCAAVYLTSILLAQAEASS